MEDAIDRTHEETETPASNHRKYTIAVATHVVALAAAQLRRGTKDVELEIAPTPPGTATLLGWGYFNPFGPTANRIDAVPVAATRELLLVSASDHPVYPDYRAIALIPAGADRAAEIRNALVPIFAANGGRVRWGLVFAVPSYVHLIPDSPIDPAYAAVLIRSAIARAGILNYSEVIHDPLHAWSDPCGQAAEAVNRSLQASAGQRLITQNRQLEAGLPEIDGDRDADGEPAQTDELFSLWFALATQPEYVGRIEGQMALLAQARKRPNWGRTFDWS